MKLLIATDSVTSTEVLVDAVGLRPWPEGTTAHVLSVVADIDVPEEISPVAKRLEEIGITSEVIVARGDARHLIPFYARKLSSDLILVRAHVRRDLQHWMLGSVARAVVTSAPCTVQIVRDEREDRKQTLHSPRRVLLATDGSEFGLAAAAALAGRPWPEGSEFRIVTVEEPWLIRPADVTGSLSSAEQVLANAGLSATVAVLSGNPKTVILEDAKQWSADLIVVGSHGRRGFKRFLLGSVSESVAMNAHCSVVVVRGSAQSSKR